MPRYGRSVADIAYSWRSPVDNAALNRLHADAFDHGVLHIDWHSILIRHSLGWVAAHDGETLVGFVNVLWDGDSHSWLQDTIVASDRRGRGIGTRLVEIATDRARSAGCEWLHVDFDPGLEAFYLEACGFEPTPAGLIRL